MPVTTMSMQITKENYPIAAACLGYGFRESITEEDAIGHYMVINILIEDPFFKTQPGVEYQNSWMTKEVFDEFYEVIRGKARDFTFEKTQERRDLA